MADLFCCQTLNGHTLDCNPNLSGISRIWYACKADVPVSAFTLDAATGTVTAIDPTAAAEFKLMEFKRNTASFEWAATNDPQGQPLFWTDTLTVILHRMQPALRLELMALAYSSLWVIVEDKNGYFHLMGYDYPVFASINGASGTTTDDNTNAYTVVFTDEQKQLPYFVTAGAMSDIIGDTEPNALYFTPNSLTWNSGDFGNSAMKAAIFNRDVTLASVNISPSGTFTYDVTSITNGVDFYPSAANTGTSDVTAIATATEQGTGKTVTVSLTQKGTGA